MNISIEIFEQLDISAVHSIWNEVIDEGESFFWRKHFSYDKISGILNNQKAVYCAKYNGEVIGFSRIGQAKGAFTKDNNEAEDIYVYHKALD